MNYDHPRYNEFMDRLAAECDARETVSPQGAVMGYNWDCDGDLSRTEAVAFVMGLDITKTLEFCKANGGHCDCEVLINVDGGEEEW